MRSEVAQGSSPFLPSGRDTGVTRWKDDKSGNSCRARNGLGRCGELLEDFLRKGSLGAQPFLGHKQESLRVQGRVFVSDTLLICRYGDQTGRSRPGPLGVSGRPRAVPRPVRPPYTLPWAYWLLCPQPGQAQAPQLQRGEAGCVRGTTSRGQAVRYVLLVLARQKGQQSRRTSWSAAGLLGHSCADAPPDAPPGDPPRGAGPGSPRCSQAPVARQHCPAGG